MSTSSAQDDPGIFWGGKLIPYSEAVKHFFVLGTVGSGKTAVLRLLMQSIMPRIGTREHKRALIFDPTGGMLSLLAGMDLNAEVITLDPLDARGAAWDIAKDTSDYINAQKIATILCPSPKDGKDFFERSARYILSLVILGMHQVSRDNWSFTELMRVTQDQEAIKRLLGETEEGRQRGTWLFGAGSQKERTDDILHTLHTELSDYWQIAMLWDQATRKVSIHDWLENDYILVLPHKEGYFSMPVDNIYKAFIQFTMDEILSQKGSASDWHNWFFLDDCYLLDSGDLTSIISQSRRAGVCCAIGLSDLEKGRMTFGENGINTIVEMCSNVAMLSAHAENGVVGHYRTANLPEFLATFDADFLKRNLLPPDPTVPAFIPRPM